VTSRFQLIPGRTHMSVLPEALNEAAAFAFPIHPEPCPSEGSK
jgi:hypothetical protein